MAHLTFCSKVWLGVLAIIATLIATSEVEATSSATMRFMEHLHGSSESNERDGGGRGQAQLYGEFLLPICTAYQVHSELRVLQFFRR